MKALLRLGIVLLIVSCSQPVEQGPEYTRRADTTRSVVTVKKKEPVKINEGYTLTARYIAGLPIGDDDSLKRALSSNASWKSYSESFSKSWNKYDSTRLQVIRNWAQVELDTMAAASDTLFYPFSGPDILNAHVWFPQAKHVVMIGLEPVGTLPDFTKKEMIDSLGDYFGSVRESMFAILKFSFFRTKAMKTDLRAKELNGTIHLLLLFLARTGNDIVDIQPVNIAYNGKPVYYDSFEKARKDTMVTKGVELKFVGKDSIVKSLQYFSVNLSDGGLKYNTGLVAYVKNMKAFNTYLKSASYLMYEKYFSIIRDLILQHSRYVLQDDSGIPFRYFSSGWDNTLYGRYKGPIGLFRYAYQADLAAAYQDSTKVKWLPFGTGYKYKLGESNLMLAKRNYSQELYKQPVAVPVPALPTKMVKPSKMSKAKIADE